MDVTAHVYVPDNRLNATVYVHHVDGVWRERCSTPCKTNLPPKARIKVVLENHADSATETLLDGEDGKEVDVVITRSGSDATAFGIVLAASGGGLFFLAGVGFLLSLIPTYGGGGATPSGRAALLGVCIGGGVVGGIGTAIVVARSWSPEIAQDPMRTSAKPPVASSLPGVSMPFSLTFAF